MSNCSWYSWLWESDTKNNQTWFEPNVQGVESPIKGSIFLFIGICGLIMNCLALTGLNQCHLAYSTLLFMKCQCSLNLVGLGSKLLCNTIVCFTGRPFPPYDWHIWFQLPGGFLVLAVYGQYALQAAMAANRLVAFCYRDQTYRWFSRERSVLYACICVLHGGWNMIMCLFPCCALYFDPISQTWKYESWGANVRQFVTLSSDLILCSVIVTCYGRTFYQLNQLRNRMFESGRAEFKRELMVLLQFFIVACTWIGYSAAYRPLYFIPKVKDKPSFVMFAELVRFWMFSIDPIIYCVFMRRLRSHVIRVITCGHFILSVRPSVRSTLNSNMKQSVRRPLYLGSKWKRRHTDIENGSNTINSLELEPLHRSLTEKVGKKTKTKGRAKVMLVYDDCTVSERNPNLRTHVYSV